MNKTTKDQELDKILKRLLADVDDNMEFVGTPLKTNESASNNVQISLNKAKAALLAWRDSCVDENTSDGYHTFKELYHYRMLYNAALFNEWASAGKYSTHKSWKHSDSEDCFGGGWFIVVATLPGGQISNHYEARDWDLFNIPEHDLADVWDGHTPGDVATRLAQLPSTKDIPGFEGTLESLDKISVKPKGEKL